MSKTGDSALLSLVDPGDEEINISSNMAEEDTFIDMNTDTEALLGGDNSEGSPAKKESVFSFAYYQSLFDVDSDDIVQRLAWSSFPRPKFTSNFAKEKIKSKPDLYGPFWICVTLVFSIAIAGNIASYFQYRFVAQEDGKPGHHWHYNFHKVTSSSAIVFLYATLVPSGLFGALWSQAPKDSPVKPSFIELVCIFGYSLAPFIPASVVWLIQISSVQWLTVLLSFGLSGGVLALALWPTVDEFSANKSKSYTLIAIVLALHLLLASGFMLCFFHVPNTGVIQSETTKSNVTLAASMVPEKTNGKALPDPTHDEKRDVNVTVVKEMNAESSEKVEKNTIDVGQNATKTTVKTSVKKKALDESSKVTE